MPTILGTRVDPTNAGDRPALNFTAIIGWNNFTEISGAYDVEVRAWEHDDGAHEDLRTAGSSRVPMGDRSYLTLEFAFPFLLNFRRVLMPTPVRFIMGEPGDPDFDWETESGDEEVYLRVRLIDVAAGTTVDRVRTRIVTGDW